jgi:hypothetical protein
LCVSANSQIVANLYVSVNIQFGSFKLGLTKTKPVVRSINAGDELASEWVDNLIDLPDKVDDLRLTFGWLDPNGGEFRISDASSTAFDTLTLRVKTMEHTAEGMYVPVAWSGNVMFRGHEYKMTSLATDRKTCSLRLLRTGVSVFGLSENWQLPNTRTSARTSCMAA